MAEHCPSTSQNGTKEFSCILAATVLAFMAFYCPQPLLASFAQEQGISQTAASLLMTVVIFPFAFAPLFYGALLRRLSVNRLLFLSTAGAGAALFLAGLSPSYPLMLAARTVQGFLLPAILLCLTTSLSGMWSGRELQSRMAIYAIMTLLGGYGGRIVAGIVCTHTSPSTTLQIFGLFQLAALLPAHFISRRESSGAHGFTLRDIVLFVTHENTRTVLFIGPLCTLAYAAVLNFLPFHMHSIDTGISEMFIGFVYVAGIVGAVFVMLTTKIVARADNVFVLLLLVMLAFTASLFLFLVESIVFAVTAMMITSILFSLIYSNCPGIVNRASPFDGGVTNSMYLSIYYLFTAAGSMFPIMLYSRSGIGPFVLLLAGISIVNMALIIVAGRKTKLG